jgi:hypothetical protein
LVVAVDAEDASHVSVAAVDVSAYPVAAVLFWNLVVDVDAAEAMWMLLLLVVKNSCWQGQPAAASRLCCFDTKMNTEQVNHVRAAVQ